MLLRILGSAAGGGVPQWNCHCSNCRLARGGTRVRPRTQSSIAVRGANSAWALINASPDLLLQLRTYPDMHPASGMRDSAIGAIVLTDGQIDHATGLLMLREATRPWPIWCTNAVYRELSEELPLLDVLGRYCGIAHHDVFAASDFVIDEIAEVQWRAHSVPSKAPPYSRDREVPQPGSNIALTISNTQSRRSAFFVPGLGEMLPELWEQMQSAELVLVDGTCWTDDELVRLGISQRRARDMGHLPLGGSGGSLEWLQRLPSSTRKVLTHINNTNPILDEASRERAALVELGIEVAYDGMEFEL